MDGLVLLDFLRKSENFLKSEGFFIAPFPFWAKNCIEFSAGH